jgi:hypothetical protein
MTPILRLSERYGNYFSSALRESAARPMRSAQARSRLPARMAPDADAPVHGQFAAQSAQVKDNRLERVPRADPRLQMQANARPSRERIDDGIHEFKKGSVANAQRIEPAAESRERFRMNLRSPFEFRLMPLLCPGVAGRSLKARRMLCIEFYGRGLIGHGRSERIHRCRPGEAQILLAKPSALRGTEKPGANKAVGKTPFPQALAISIAPDVICHDHAFLFADPTAGHRVSDAVKNLIGYGAVRPLAVPAPGAPKTSVLLSPVNRPGNDLHEMAKGTNHRRRGEGLPHGLCAGGRGFSRGLASDFSPLPPPGHPY